MADTFTSITEWQQGPANSSFFTKRWMPPAGQKRAKLIFVHGFMEHILRYDHVFSRHAKSGIEVFAFDQRGFGQTGAKTKTPGKTSWVEAIEDLNFFIKQEADPKLVQGVKVFLMGHSMGGGLAFAYPTRSPATSALKLITGGIILSSPLIDQPSSVATWGPILRLGSFIGAWSPSLTIKVGVSPQDICRDPVVQDQYSHDPLCAPIGTYKGVADMILGGKELLERDYQNYPGGLELLAVHGTADKVTCCNATEKLIEKTNARDKTFKAFEGYYHEMHNEPGELKFHEIDFIISWIMDRVETKS